MAQQAFAWIAGLLDKASYNERTGRALHVVHAELGRLCGWSVWDAGTMGWRNATTSPPCALPTVPMTGHLAPASSRP